MRILVWIGALGQEVASRAKLETVFDGLVSRLLMLCPSDWDGSPRHNIKTEFLVG